MKAFATRRIIAEQYDSIGELIDMLKVRDYSKYYVNAVNKHKVSNKFHYCDDVLARVGIGTDNVDCDESLDFALNGTDMFDDLIRNNDASSFEIESDDMELDVKRPMNSIVGSSPNVGRFIAGQPNCMRRRVHRDYSVRRNVRIIYTLDAPYFITTEQRVNCGVMMLKALQTLQANGYSVEFHIGYACGNEKQHLTYFLEIPMKEYDTALNIRKMIYPVVSPACLFHIGRNWQEKMPVGIYLYRYGISAWNDPDQRSVMKRYFERENQVWLTTDIIIELTENIDSREGLRKLVDFILNEKEIDTDPDDTSQDDVLIVNRYQEAISGGDGAWSGLEIGKDDGNGMVKDKPINQKTRNIIITGMLDNLTEDKLKNLPVASNADSDNTVKVSWWTLRMNSIRNWWRNLFGDAGDAFNDSRKPDDKW